MGITVSGMGSGLDINTLVSQLMSIERFPLTKLEQDEAQINSKISAYGQIKSALSKLEEAANALTKTNTFSATKSSSSDTGAVTATSTSSAQIGTYSIDVTRIAKAQRLATSSAGAPAIAAGNLQVTVGTQSPIDITVADGDTLQDVRDAINVAFKDSPDGVVAQVINNGSAEQLVLTSKKTGEPSAFKLVGSGGMSAFSFDPAAPGGNLTVVQAAENALLSIDGISVTRASNTVSDVIDGVTLSLVKEGVSANINVEADQDVTVKAVEDMVKAYNDVIGLIKGKSAYDEKGKATGILNGDGNLRSIQGALRGALTYVGPADGRLMMSEAGIAFKADGTLSVDVAKLKTVLSDPTKDFEKLMAGTDAEPGFMRTLEKRVQGLVDADGIIDIKTTSLQKQIKRLDQQQDRLTAMLEKKEAHLVQRYAALDSTLSAMMQQGNFISSLKPISFSE